MNEFVLESYLKCIIANFNVTFEIVAIDELQSTQNSNLPKLLIVNTFKRNNKVGHWCICHLYRTRKFGVNADFFCSFGSSPESYNMQFPFHITWVNRKVLQPLYSDNCGLYVILFAYYRLRRIAPSKIVTCIFDETHKENNELRVIRFGKRLRRSCGGISDATPTLCASTGAIKKRHCLSASQDASSAQETE